jgi:hypothetical protein
MKIIAVKDEDINDETRKSLDELMPGSYIRIDTHGMPLEDIIPYLQCNIEEHQPTLEDWNEAVRRAKEKRDKNVFRRLANKIFG